MVYTRVSIVIGVVGSSGEVLTDDNSTDGFLEVNTLGKTTPGGDDVLISSIHNHCHDEEMFIVGIELHEYYRKHNCSCGDCEKYACCDACIGQTNNGYYNVQRMVTQPVEVNLRHLCFHCYSDNKEDLQAPRADHDFSDKNKPFSKEGMFCKTCGLKPDPRFTPETIMKRDSYRYQQLKLFIADKMPSLAEKEIKFYYLLDDCLCCT
jgi:hypothetical protein